MRHQSSLDLATGHLNASVGQVLTAGQLALALRAGSIRGPSSSPMAAALISSLFIELAPELILRCAAEADADIQHVNQLYRETLADALPRARAWENAVEHFL